MWSTPITFIPFDLHADSPSFKFSVQKKMFMLSFLFITLSSMVPGTAMFKSLHKIIPFLRAANTSIESGLTGSNLEQSLSVARTLLMTFA